MPIWLDNQPSTIPLFLCVFLARFAGKLPDPSFARGGQWKGKTVAPPHFLLCPLSTAKSRHSRPCSSSGGEPHWSAPVPVARLPMAGQGIHSPTLGGRHEVSLHKPTWKFRRLILSVGGVIVHPTGICLGG
jgi:hypothetical protein